MLVTVSHLIHTLTPPSVFWAFTLVLAAVLFKAERRHEALIVILTTVSTTVITTILKHALAIPRPSDALITLSSYAFPSAHAASAAVLAVLLIWLTRAWRTPGTRKLLHFFILVLAMIIGGHRIIIGVHTEVQVLAGFMLGTLVSYGVIALMENDLLPGLRYRCDRGFLLRHEWTLEHSSGTWFVLSALPFDVPTDLSFIQTHGRRKISDAPDAVFFKVNLTNEFESFAESLT